jgi:hypothetical protein
LCRSAPTERVNGWPVANIIINDKATNSPQAVNVQGSGDWSSSKTLERRTGGR